MPGFQAQGYSLVIQVAGLGVDLEAFVLDDAGVGDFAPGEVHDGHALVAGRLQSLCLEPEPAVLERAEPEAAAGVDGAGADHLVRDA